MQSECVTEAKNMVKGGINPSIKSISPQREKRINQDICLTNLFLSIRTKFDNSNIHAILPWMK